ncbi:PREDICTED: 40S ribosomal protein S27-like [Tinamus guttatus]|uniref:40S ribosomal protein S27-like n=1 Tax=Tinamus guttatus TaxID=94827 RepID=UPI00052EC5F7|nr:PREDICTED: 40S ribosomal protein S27-like [Tinamus guttatus]
MLLLPSCCFRTRIATGQGAGRERGRPERPFLAEFPAGALGIRCYKITTVFSHAQTVVLCVGCSTVLCQPTGGKARLTEGCSFRRKQH